MSEINYYPESCSKCDFRLQNQYIIGGGMYLCTNGRVLDLMGSHKLDTAERVGISIMQYVGFSDAYLPCYETYQVCQGTFFKPDWCQRVLKSLTRVWRTIAFWKVN